MADEAADLRAPFPWFGGKRRVAPQVWEALGDVGNYIEPFAGSLAVLLGRPAGHAASLETVNDADGYVANFWRALADAPDAVAYWADWPVNEVDLTARHLWLVSSGRDRLAAMDDPGYYDAQVAGWWVWGLCAWIGSGWCGGDVHRQRPYVGAAGMGVHRQLPHLGDAGRGVHRKRPHLSAAGMGVHRQLPHLGDAGMGVHRQLPHLGRYLAGLAERLRSVRVCCGDWTRVMGPAPGRTGTTVGYFLDPPYSQDARDSRIYSTDTPGLSDDVLRWAVEHGSDSRTRIVLAGYASSDDDHVPSTWRRLRSIRTGTYTRDDEILWFSPGCLPGQPTLF